MKYEFEKIAGYEVSDNDYANIIEPMYMATKLSKSEFVKTLDKQRFALKTKKQIEARMKKIAKHLKEICGKYKDYEAETKLMELSREYARRFSGINAQTNGMDWINFVYEYECPELQRGCTYPKILVMGRGNNEINRIKLV